MKNVLKIVGGFIFLFAPSLALASTDIWSATFVPDNNTTQITYNTGSIPSNYFGSFDGTGSNKGYVGYSTSAATIEAIWYPFVGKMTIVEFVPGTTDCQSGSLASCESSGVGFIREHTLCVVDSTPCTPPPPPDTSLPAQIAAAEQGMASTTGFSIGSVTTWSGDNLIKLFIGSGLGVIYGLRYWIVAMLIISAIVLFSFRGMRFFRTR